MFFSGRNPDAAFLERYLVFPVESGANWRAKQFWDSSAVVDVASMTVPAGTFDHAFMVYQKGWIPNNPFYHTEWFVPDEGLICTRQYSFFTLDMDNGRSESVWELVSFTPPERSAPVRLRRVPRSSAVGYSPSGVRC